MLKEGGKFGTACLPLPTEDLDLTDKIGTVIGEGETDNDPDITDPVKKLDMNVRAAFW